MANTFSNLYPTLWSEEAFYEFANASKALSLVDTRYLDGAGAQTLRLPVIPYSEVSGTALDVTSELYDAPDAVTISTTTLSTVRADGGSLGFHFEVKYDEQDMAAAQLGAGIARQRIAALASHVDREIFGVASSATHALSGATVGKTALVSAAQLLNESNIPLGDRILVVNPAGLTELLSDGNLADADRIEGNVVNRDALPDGTSRIGFRIYLVPSAALSLADCDALAFGRSAIVCAFARNLTPRVYDSPRTFAVGFTGHVNFGATLLHSTAAVRIVRA